jgi:hypothetical protein
MEYSFLLFYCPHTDSKQCCNAYFFLYESCRMDPKDVLHTIDRMMIRSEWSAPSQVILKSSKSILKGVMTKSIEDISFIITIVIY